MSETLKQTRLFRFDQMAVQVKDKVDPAEANVDRYVGLEHLDPESLKIRRWGETSEVESSKIIFKCGDIIFGKRRAYQRKLAVADFDGICSAHAMVLRPKTDVVLEELLPFFMQSDIFMDRAVKISVGGLSPTINWKDLAKQEFALPPLEEQLRIAEVLQACEGAANGIQQLIDATHSSYLATLNDFFSCALGPEPADGSSCSSSGAHWEWRRVDEMFSLQLGKMSSKKARASGEHAEYIKNNNVLWGGFSLDDLPSMSFDEREREKFSLEPGDLLVCEGGEIGRAAIWPGSHHDIYFQKALHRLRPIRPDANTRFFMHYLRACSLNGILNRIATGGTILHLPRERLAELRLPFPDTSEQRRCLEILQSLQDSLQESTRRFDQLKSFKGALLIEGLMP